MPFGKLVTIFLTGIALAGCTTIDAIDRATVPLDVYELRAPDPAPTTRSTQAIDFIVEVPTTSGAINTDRILIRPDRNQIQYLPEGRWSEAAPLMLQTAMVETFLRANAFRYAGRRPLASSGDVALVTHLVEFGAELEPDGDGANVNVALVARLVREETAEVVATRSFARTVPVPNTDTQTIVTGFERATNGLLIDLANWVFRARWGAAGPS